jgi:hypothetical protein
MTEETLVLEFSGVSVDQYNAVNKILGIDPISGEGDWPDGMISHVGATGAGGTLLVVEVWTNQAAQEAFMSSRLGPALGQVGLPEPSRVEWFTVVGSHST